VGRSAPRTSRAGSSVVRLRFSAPLCSLHFLAFDMLYIFTRLLARERQRWRGTWHGCGRRCTCGLTRSSRHFAIRAQLLTDPKATWRRAVSRRTTFDSVAMSSPIRSIRWISPEARGAKSRSRRGSIYRDRGDLLRR